ncbi:MAG: hypothetical protein QM749_17955 [Aquabacterium sp.]
MLVLSALAFVFSAANCIVCREAFSTVWRATPVAATVSDWADWFPDVGTPFADVELSDPPPPPPPQPCNDNSKTMAAGQLTGFALFKLREKIISSGGEHPKHSRSSTSHMS